MLSIEKLDASHWTAVDPRSRVQAVNVRDRNRVLSTPNANVNYTDVPGFSQAQLVSFEQKSAALVARRAGRTPPAQAAGGRAARPERAMTRRKQSVHVVCPVATGPAARIARAGRVTAAESVGSRSVALASACVTGARLGSKFVLGPWSPSTWTTLFRQGTRRRMRYGKL